MVRRFYAADTNAMAWFDDHGLRPDAALALRVLRSSTQDGMDPARYDVDRLAAPLAAGDPGLIAHRDLQFTAAVLRYASDMLNGRPDLRSIDHDIDLPQGGYDPASGLARALADHKLDSFFGSLAPKTSDYAALKTALAQYRDIDAKGGWMPFESAKPFRADDAGAGVLETLRTRLAFEDASLPTAGPVVAKDVDAAVRRFQMRNGLEGDGLVGPKTVELLNITAGERVRQIAANLERMRWLPHVLEPNRVVVNVPDARLSIIDHDRAVLSSPVIVGKPRTRTPIFRAEVTQVIANPPWNVPGPIARGEILPRIARDPGYLARHNMVMANGRIQQLPGDSNALGHLKVDLDDPFVVYLHDTPSRGLFNRTDRFLSHGCVRVQQIFPLASYALSGDTAAGIERLQAAVATHQTTHLPVNARTPVYMVYFTAFPSPSGLQFRSDIYGRDQRLIAAMSGTRFAQGPANNGCHGKA